MSPDPCGSTVALAREATTQEIKSDILTPYPNPFTAAFTLRINGADDEVSEVAVVTNTGMPVARFSNIKSNTDYDNIGEDWPKGIYIVKVIRGKEVSTHMVVKK